MLAEGVKVALGSYGGSYRSLDLFTEMNIMIAGMTGYYGSPFLDFNVITPKDALLMATRNGAKALMFESSGTLKEGYSADITIINTHKSHLIPLHDPFTLPFFASGNDVSEVIVDGKLIMKNGTVLTLDEEKILTEVLEITPIVQERIKRILSNAK